MEMNLAGNRPGEFTYDCHGNHSAMIYTLMSREEIVPELWQSLQEAKIPQLIPMRKVESGLTYLLYDLHGLIQYDAYLERVNSAKRKEAARRKEEALAVLLDSGVPREFLLLDQGKIYVEEETGKVRYGCRPVERLDTMPAFPLGASPAPAAEQRFRQSDATQVIIDAVLIRKSNQEKFHMTRSPYRVGRKAESVDACITGNDRIGRIHAVLYYGAGKYYLEDMKSTNGTSLNGVRLQPHMMVELHSGCVIGMANEEFIFERIAP